MGRILSAEFLPSASSPLRRGRSSVGCGPCCRSEVMLVLFDSPAGHCLFKVTDSGLLKKPEDIWDAFTSAAAAKKACAACAHARIGAVVSAEPTLLTFGAYAATG